MLCETVYVFVNTGFGDVVLAGKFTLDHQDDGRIIRGGRFKYARKYQEREDAFALDPIHLPLNDAVHFTPLIMESGGIFGVLLDAGPDKWGKTVLTQRYKPTPATPVDFLLASAGHGVGALQFSNNPDHPPVPAVPNLFDSLDDIHEVADMIVAGKPVDLYQLQCFEYGSALGGMRPKCQIQDNGDVWIAKFDRSDDPFSVCRAEYVCMQMARKAGIHTADVRLEETSKGPVLLVKRFDVEDGIQHHMISLCSLLNAMGSPRWEAAMTGAVDASYSGMAKIARQISSSGQEDAEEIYRRMLFNVAVGNTDDHLKNHAFMKCAGNTAYDISPAFDVVPNPALLGSHAMGLGGSVNNANSPSAINFASAAQNMGITQGRAKAIAQEIMNVVAGWEPLMRASQIPDTAGIAKCFQSMITIEQFAK